MEREQTLAARQDRFRVELELRLLRKQHEVIERQGREAAQEVERQRQYAEALAGGDHAWLLADQRRVTKQVRNRINVVRRQAQPGTLDEL